MKCYHIGLLQRKQTAVFQLRSTKDELSCEILEYFGTTCYKKNEVKLTTHRLYRDILDGLNIKYPNKHFTHVVVD